MDIPQAKDPAAHSREIDALYRSLPGQWPLDYPLLSQIGDYCTIGGDLRITQPQDVESTTVEWRERIAEYWCWPKKRFFNPKIAQSCYLIADTSTGDELALNPANGLLTFLCRHRDWLFGFRSAKILDVIYWLEASGEYQEPRGSHVYLRAEL